MFYPQNFGETETKKRKLYVPVGSTREIWTVSGVKSKDTTNEYGYNLTQVTVSRDNKGWLLKKRYEGKKATWFDRKARPQGPYSHLLNTINKVNLGNGQFTTYKQSVDYNAVTISAKYVSGIQTKTAVGQVVAVAPGQGPLPTYPTFSEADLWAKGGRAISGVRPTDANSSLLVFLGEVKREGIPSLSPSALRDKIAFFRSLGNDYLNLEFGWKPFLSELRSLAKSVSSSDKVIEAYAANSSKPIRTRYTFPEIYTESAVTTTNNQPGYPVFHQDLYTSLGVRTAWSSQTEKTWFEGMFRYHLAADRSQMDKFKRNSQLANKLLGTRLTPETLWNLTPWSWLVDWVLDIGQLVGNLSYLGQDGLVMQYGYIMQHGVKSKHYELAGLRFRGESGYRHLSLTQNSEYKLRRSASPYGFGLNLDGFSAKQWSILAALGIAKGPGSVRYN